jgi:hypothetical protein
MLEANKKLVVAMASNSKAKDLDKKLRDSYPDKKVLLIHRETTDEDKKNLLLKVNDEWIKYDVIIYTPSVCMGVSFDITGHFDYIFAYGCHESLGAQEWCQMIHRVRSPINKEIFIAIDQYKPFEQTDDLIDYKTVEKMLCSDYYLTNYDLHNNLVHKKVKRVVDLSANEINQSVQAVQANQFIQANNLDNGIESDSDADTGFIDSACSTIMADTTCSSDLIESESTTNIYDEIPNIGSISLNDKVLFYPYKSEPIYDLYVRNSWEIIENKLNFPACFFGYAKFKEYKLQYLALTEEDNEILQEMKTIRDEREEIEFEEKVNGIVAAPDLSSEEYSNKIKQRDEYITKDDMYSIYRYNLRKCYNVYPNDDADANADPDNDNIDNAYINELSLANGDITKDFVAEYNDKEKMKWYRNLATILSTDTQTTDDKLDILKDNQQYESIITNCYIEFTNKNKYSYHYYPLNILKIIGFDVNDLSISISYPNLITKIYDAIGWCDARKEEISYKYNIKISSKNLSQINEIEQMKYINRIIESQYGLKIRRINNSVHKDNILYRLDDSNIWSNLNNIDIDAPEELDMPFSVYNLKNKIVPIELKYKRMNKTNDFDTTNLDVFIDDE